VLKIKMHDFIGRSRTRVVQCAVSCTDFTHIGEYACGHGSINVVHRVSTHLPLTCNKAYYVIVSGKLR
jgi:hypothetical protein